MFPLSCIYTLTYFYRVAPPCLALMLLWWSPLIKFFNSIQCHEARSRLVTFRGITHLVVKRKL